MDEEIEVLKQHVESLGLNSKNELTTEDRSNLTESLMDSDELTLAKYVNQLQPNQLMELIKDSLYD